jgi:hypothetical protein
MIYYDPDKDRSEEFAWKKYYDERRPTEQEQDRWSKIMLLFSVILIIIGFTIGG